MHTRTNVPEHVDQPKPRYIGSNILEKHGHETHALELCCDRCLHRRLSYELYIAIEHLLCVTYLHVLLDRNPCLTEGAD